MPKAPPRKRWTVTLKPARSRIARASSSCLRSTSGTRTISGPLDTTTVTLPPRKSVPPAGSWRTTDPFGTVVLNSCRVRVDGQPGVGERGDGRVGGLPGPVHDVDRLAALAQHERDLRRPLDRGPGCGVGGDDLPGGDGLVVGLADRAHLQPPGGELALGVGPAAADEVGHGVALGSLGDRQPDRGPSPEVGPGAGVAGQHDAGADLLVEGTVDLRGEVAAREPLLGLGEGERHHRRAPSCGRPGRRGRTTRRPQPRRRRARAPPRATDGADRRRPARRRAAGPVRRRCGRPVAPWRVRRPDRPLPRAARPPPPAGASPRWRPGPREPRPGRVAGPARPGSGPRGSAAAGPGRRWRPPAGRRGHGRSPGRPAGRARAARWRPGWRARARCCARAGRRRGWGCRR